MKLRIKLVLFVGVFFLMCFCQNKTDEAKKVAQTYLNHLNQFDFEKAKELGTTSTVMMLEQIQSLISLSETENETMSEDDLTIISCDIDKDTAICKFEVDEQVQELKLVFIKKKWWVHTGDELPEIK
ncbi:hypothetical protein ACFL6I_18690 [candidate division KSB1 bacterium]